MARKMKCNCVRLTAVIAIVLALSISGIMLYNSENADAEATPINGAVSTAITGMLNPANGIYDQKDYPGATIPVDNVYQPWSGVGGKGIPNYWVEITTVSATSANNVTIGANTYDSISRSIGVGYNKDLVISVWTIENSKLYIGVPYLIANVPTGENSVQISLDGTSLGTFQVLSSNVSLKTSGLTFQSTNGGSTTTTHQTTSDSKFIIGGIFNVKNPKMGFQIDGSTAALGNPVVRMDPQTGSLSITCRETSDSLQWDYMLYADGWKKDTDAFVNHLHTREMVVTDINGNRAVMIFTVVMNPQGGECVMAVGSDNKLSVTLNSGTFTIEKGRTFTLYDGITLTTNGHLQAVELMMDGLHCYTSSVTEALDMAKNTECTITLLMDVTEDIYVKDGQKVTLDLNGHTITNVANDTIICKGTLIIDDNSEDKSGKVQSIIPGKAVISSLIASDKTSAGGLNKGQDYTTDITINGGTFLITAAGGYYVIDNSGKMTINGGIFKTESTADASLVRNVSWETADLTINNGKFYSGTNTLNTIKNHTFSRITINDGQFWNTAQYVIENAGTMTISGGDFIAGNNSVIGNMGYNNTSDPNSGTLSISGGFFDYGDGKAAIQHFSNDYGASIGKITISDSVSFSRLLIIPAGAKISSTNAFGKQMTGSITFGEKAVNFTYSDPITSTSDIVFQIDYSSGSEEMFANVKDYSDLLKVYSAGADGIYVSQNITMTSKLVIDRSLTLKVMGSGVTITGNTSDKSVFFEINGGQLSVHGLRFTDFGNTDSDLTDVDDVAVFKMSSGATASSLALTNVTIESFIKNAIHASAGTITLTGTTITGSEGNNGIVIDDTSSAITASISNSTITGMPFAIKFTAVNQNTSQVTVTGNTLEGTIGSTSANNIVSVTGELSGQMTLQNVSPRTITLKDTSTEITLVDTQYSSTAFTSGVESKGAFLVGSVVKLLTPYQVTFNTGVSGVTVDPITVGEGQKFTAPTAPTATGKVFKGWYKDAAFGTAWAFDTDTVTAATTLYAKWANIHTLTFDVNGGTAISPVQYENGQSVTLPTPTWEGHTFNGWSPNIDTMPDNDVTVVASWSITPEPSAPKYTVSGSVTVTGATEAIVVSLLSEGATAYTTPVSAGSFSISDVVGGIYTLSVTSGDFSSTSSLTVSADVNVGTLTYNIRAESTVDTDDDTIVTNGASSESQALLSDLAAGTTVDVTVSIKTSQTPTTTEQSVAQQALKQESARSNIMFLEIDVTKAVTPLGGTTEESKMSETTTVFEFIIPFDVNKSNLSVLRYHGGMSEQLTRSTAGTDGTYYVDAGFGVIHLFTSKFSTYAIAYGTVTVPDVPDHPSYDDSDYPFPPGYIVNDDDAKDDSDDSKKLVAIAAAIVVIMMASLALAMMRRN